MGWYWANKERGKIVFTFFKYIKQFYREIKAVGFKDWCWFTFYLRRTEFSPKLDVDFFSSELIAFIYDKSKPDPYIKIIKLRERAHRVSNKILDVKIG